VEDLDGEVVALVAQEILGLSLQDNPCPVVRVDDVVADLESALDGADLRADFDPFFSGS
jgi:hypothetical protein